tara:strand:+ start:249 stop:683 length:435 start_codon:yes stop_codon:yes gene_type:complete
VSSSLLKSIIIVVPAWAAARDGGAGAAGDAGVFVGAGGGGGGNSELGDSELSDSGDGGDTEKGRTRAWFRNLCATLAPTLNNNGGAKCCCGGGGGNAAIPVSTCPIKLVGIGGTRGELGASSSSMSGTRGEGLRLRLDIIYNTY